MGNFELYNWRDAKPIKGSCFKGVCGNDAACHDNGNGTHFCVCPHDLSVATEDLLCPNRATVSGRPSSLLPIPIVVRQNSSVTSNTSMLTVEGNNHVQGPNSLVISVLSVGGFAAFVLTSLIILFLYRRRRKLPSKIVKDFSEMETPVALSKGLLEAHKFTNNPHYLTLNNSVKSIPQHKITFLEAIGEGYFGKVYKGELEMGSGGGFITVAIKVLKDSASHEAEQDFMREVEIMSSFDHSNILSLIGISLKEPSKCPWMVFEYMPFGDLTDVLRSNNILFRNIQSNAPVLNEGGLLSIALQIAHGMDYLAAQHFVHRDLACRNCLVGENLTVKIADFGMSRDVYTCDYYKIGGSRMLPVRWMPPESITFGKFTLESDVWSYGVVLWEIFSYGKQPYFGHSNEQVVKLILNGTRLSFPENCPNGIAQLMSACWIPEPKDRISFPSIVEKLERLFSEQLPLPPSLSQFTRLASVTSRCASDSVSLTSSDTSHRGSVASDLDSECYLRPNPPLPPHEYLQTFSDSPTNSASIVSTLIN